MSRYLLIVLLYLCIIRSTSGHADLEENKKDMYTAESSDTPADHSMIYDALNFDDLLDSETYTMTELQERAIGYYKQQIDMNPAGKNKLKNVIALLGKTLLFLNNYEDMITYIKCEHCGPYVPKLSKRHPQIKQHFLLTLKSLILIAPADIKATIPLNIADILAEYFETDVHVGVKNNVLKVLNVWLPDNPAAQVRIIEFKGLEAFYNQLVKLDANGVYTFFDLFSKILREHITARDQSAEKTAESLERLQTYERIGLLEHLTNPKICYGLLTFLERIFVFEQERDNFMAPIFETLKLISKSCLGYFRRKSQSGRLFKAFLDYASKPEVKKSYERINVNMTEVVDVLTEYVNELSTQKSEL